MPKFIMEAEFLVPHLVRYCVEAETEAEAIVKFKRMEESDSCFWDGQFEDFDSCRSTTYTNVTDEYDNPETYADGERACGEKLIVPNKYHDDGGDFGGEQP